MSGGSSSGPQVPPMSSQEKNLMAEQTALLKQQQNMTQQSFQTQNLLAPFLYQSLGLTPTMDAKGNITGFAQDPSQKGIQQQQQQITSELLNRQQQALEGNLPVDPALIDNLNQQEAQLHDQLSKNLGPGYATSTSGIMALDRFNTSKNSILEGARRGDLTMAEQLALGMQSGANQNSGFLSQASGSLAGQGANYGQLFGQVAQGYNSPISVLDNLRSQQFQANTTAYQANAATMSGLGSGIGSLVGTLGSAAILASSKTFKEEMEGGEAEVLSSLSSLPIKRWKYKEEFGYGTDTHIGPYAEDFKDRFGVGDGKTIAIVDYLGVQLAATKELAEKVDKLSNASFLKDAA